MAEMQSSPSTNDFRGKREVETSGPASEDNEVPEHVGGLALTGLMIGLTMAAFLLMIDSTILVTVSNLRSSTRDKQPEPQTAKKQETNEGRMGSNRPSQAFRATLIHSKMSVGMGAHTCLQRTYNCASYTDGVLQLQDILIQVQHRCVFQLLFGKLYDMYSSKASAQYSDMFS